MFEPKHCQENVPWKLKMNDTSQAEMDFKIKLAIENFDLSHILSEFIAKCILTVSSLKKMLIFIIQSKPKTFEKEPTKRFSINKWTKTLYPEF